MIKWFKNLFKKKPEPLIVWGITGTEDHKEDGYSMTMIVSQGENVQEAQFWFEEEADAEHIIKHFQDTISPLTLDMKEYEFVR